MNGTATGPKLEEMILCMVVPYVNCVCLVTLSGCLELWLAWAGGPGTLCAGAALVGWLVLKWAQARDVCIEGTLG